MRCFVAIELEPDVRRSLSRYIRGQPGAGKDVRWCTEEQLHVTLRFLGDVDDARLPQVCERVTRTSAEIAAFEIHVGGVACFPPRGSPRVLWAGVDDPTASCARWVESAEPKFVELGFETERRPYTPHVTLARSRTAGGGTALRRAAGSDGPAMTAMRVERITLFESRLAPGGAQHIPFMSAALGGPTP